ncbi:MFS transporter [Citrobacter freundii]|uniref:MFS transporter n=1 Tax=Citrobacter freundii TaxID=546 RepID=UPI001FFE1C82|nr:MFS transporter [Citrobacter freundii]
MNTRPGLLLLLFISGSFLLTGCAKTSSIDARKTKTGASHQEQISSTSQLTDQDVFGNELTLEITEEDIQNAVEEAKGQFDIPLNSAVVLVKSGSRAPDEMMQKEMQRYYQVTGVPLGTFIGQHFGWRETFLAVSMLGVIALISSQLLIPANIPGRAAASIRDQVKVLTHPRLLLIYAVTALGYGGVFTAFTFLAPMMQDLAGFSPAAVSWILLGYGVSVAIGNIWGGKLADKHGAVPALKFIFAALFVLLMVFQVTASTQYAALATILVMGIFAFGNVPGLQVYVVQKAEQFTPNAVDVASGLNIAAFNIGIALGSVIGGQTVEHYGLAQTPWIGALIVLVAFLLMGLSGRLDKPARVALG